MEHLGAEISQLPELPRVKLVADLTDIKDANGEAVRFHQFHEGAFGWCINDRGKLVASRNISWPDRPDLRWSETKFVQRWLWFEVIREIFEDIEGFELEHFITQRNDAGFANVTTEQLPDYLRKWRDRERKNRKGRFQRLIHAQQVLDQARHYAFQYLSTHARRSRGAWPVKWPVKWPVSDDVALSILVLGEALTRTLRKIQKDKEVDFKIEGWHSQDDVNQGWGYSRLALKLLKYKNLEDKSIDAMQGVLNGSTIGLLWALRIGAPPLHRQVNEGVYNLYHRQDCASERCWDIEPIGIEYNESIGEIIRNGRIPLFKYETQSGILKVDSMSTSFDESYAVFSHVWSDGFGNPRKNSINKCVLELFAGLFEEVRAQRTTYSSGRNIDTSFQDPELFWIDTLAIPVGEEWQTEKKKAIAQMHDIYSHAEYTIVLDKGLMDKQSGDGHTTPAFMITLSAWISRLWTLQEAILSQNLYFNFSNVIYPMSHLETMFRQEESIIDFYTPTLARTYYKYILGSERHRWHGADQEPGTIKPAASFVANVWKAIQWRTTQHERHEALVLATLFGLKTDYFADASNPTTADHIPHENLEERMEQLLVLLADVHPCAIPPGMIFLPGIRLSKKGFRWAPHSWLSAQEVEHPDPLQFNQRPASLRDGEGLEVCFPGFRLHELEQIRNELPPLNKKPFHFPTDKGLHKWYLVQPADEGKWPDKSEFGGCSVAIICPRDPVSSEPEIALLVTIRAEKRGRIFAEIMRRVKVSREFRESQLSKCKLEFRQHCLDAQCYGEPLPDNQSWCIDGPAPGEPLKPPGDQVSIVDNAQKFREFASMLNYSSLAAALSWE